MIFIKNAFEKALYIATAPAALRTEVVGTLKSKTIVKNLTQFMVF